MITKPKLNFAVPSSMRIREYKLVRVQQVHVQESQAKSDFLFENYNPPILTGT